MIVTWVGGTGEANAITSLFPSCWPISPAMSLANASRSLTSSNSRAIGRSELCCSPLRFRTSYRCRLGTSAVLGLPLVLLAAQFLYGRKTPWLPRIVAERSIARTEFIALLARVNPVLRRVERILRPRLGVLVSPAAERVLGIVLLGLSLILFLPIPFGNMLPAAAICLMSLALVEHDGLIVVLGALLGTVAVLIVWGAVLALVRTAFAALDTFGLLGA
jgi:hypothetical protein